MKNATGQMEGAARSPWELVEQISATVPEIVISSPEEVQDKPRVLVPPTEIKFNKEAGFGKIILDMKNRLPKPFLLA